MLVKFFATYRGITGCKTMQVSAPCDVLSLMEELCQKWPDFRDKLLDEDGTEIGKDAIILVNGRSVVHLEGAKTPLSENDYVSVFPLVAGG